MKLTFILNRPRNPHNIGAAARGMANFGFEKLAVVQPYRVAWRETRAAVHASDVVLKAKKFDSLKRAIGRAHIVFGTSVGSRRSLTSGRWITPDEARSLLAAATRAKQSAVILFGSEKSGLSNDDLAFCHYIIRIPTVAKIPSMNLAQAVTVLAYSLREVATTVPAVPKREDVPSAEKVERLISQGLKALTAAGLLKGWDQRRSERRLRQTFNRWDLSPVDVAMLHALFRWVLNKSA